MGNATGTVSKVTKIFTSQRKSNENANDACGSITTEKKADDNLDADVTDYKDDLDQVEIENEITTSLMDVCR